MGRPNAKLCFFFCFCFFFFFLFVPQLVIRRIRKGVAGIIGGEREEKKEKKKKWVGRRKRTIIFVLCGIFQMNANNS